MRAAIVGGGWAGLSAAVELAQAGVRVTLFEAAKQLGGRARSVEVQGQRLDNGQHILLGAYRETLRLMQQVGADPARLLRRLPLELHFPGSQPTPFQLRLPPLPSPWHLAAGLFAARGAALAEKIAAARCLRALQRTGYRIGDDCTVAAWLDRHGQHGSLRAHLWEALCLAALNTRPEQASAQIFVNTLRDTLGSGRGATDLLLPAADLDQVFPAAAARFIGARGGEIRRSTRVETMTNGPAIDGERFDAVVIAVAPQHAAALLAPHPETAAVTALLAAYRFEPIATVYCGYPPQVGLPFPMLGLGQSLPGQVGQWVFDRGALCGTPGVLSFVLSGHGAWERLDNRALAATLQRELAAALHTHLPPLLWQQVIRERRATFSCRPALPRASVHSGLAGCWLAGDHVCAEYPATLEAAVKSGVAAAREILVNAPLRDDRRACAAVGNSARQSLRHE
jgi:squalene-associated FAD-dependent desaturase